MCLRISMAQMAQRQQPTVRYQRTPSRCRAPSRSIPAIANSADRAFNSREHRATKLSLIGQPRPILLAISPLIFGQRLPPVSAISIYSISPGHPMDCTSFQLVISWSVTRSLTALRFHRASICATRVGDILLARAKARPSGCLSTGQKLGRIGLTRAPLRRSIKFGSVKIRAVTSKY